MRCYKSSKKLVKCTLLHTASVPSLNHLRHHHHVATLHINDSGSLGGLSHSTHQDILIHLIHPRLILTESKLPSSQTTLSNLVMLRASQITPTLNTTSASTSMPAGRSLIITTTSPIDHQSTGQLCSFIHVSNGAGSNGIGCSTLRGLQRLKGSLTSCGLVNIRSDQCSIRRLQRSTLWLTTTMNGWMTMLATLVISCFYTRLSLIRRSQ
jgi:hypothetical protein